MFIIDAESNVASSIKTEIGLNGQEMKKYLVYNDLKGRKESTLLIGVDNVMLKGNNK